eukprot:TRINITY_DN3362_c0_g1_i11.p1 TRINITY_DN3362_c0_g1~~TRINITY_DN3362_c0_g1_i11.p1  ORF type:complete len:117 (+),score=4.52 TRINITY_DN3362_c0_g1_i11:372-722(+)
MTNQEPADLAVFQPTMHSTLPATILLRILKEADVLCLLRSSCLLLLSTITNVIISLCLNTLIKRKSVSFVQDLQNQVKSLIFAEEVHADLLKYYSPDVVLLGMITKNRKLSSCESF